MIRRRLNEESCGQSRRVSISIYQPLLLQPCGKPQGIHKIKEKDKKRGGQSSEFLLPLLFIPSSIFYSFLLLHPTYPASASSPTENSTTVASSGIGAQGTSVFANGSHSTVPGSSQMLAPMSAGMSVPQ